MTDEQRVALYEGDERPTDAPRYTLTGWVALRESDDPIANLSRLRFSARVLSLDTYQQAAAAFATRIGQEAGGGWPVEYWDDLFAAWLGKQWSSEAERR